ncbi:glycosyltransferase [Flavobacterium sp. W21_SRS_FM6]|uniref:glycosyltransferase n=1 Tax=Flavobacterium sp. W21_SRS_FM6 TaxID=3240268 RepID=UPI003F8F1891
MFQHYVITRFNLRQKDWLASKSNNEVLTDEWMENRLTLFSHYCFPSLLKQSTQNFTWLGRVDLWCVFLQRVVRYLYNKARARCSYST